MNGALIFLAAIATSTCSASEPARQSARERLAASVSSVNWDQQGLIADLDCDGRDDEAYLGHRPSEVYVGMVRAAGGEPQALPFEVGAATQRAICSEPAHLKTESLAGGPPEDIGRIQGYPSSASCMGLVLSGGECDNVHIFWNTVNRRFEWWRR